MKLVATAAAALALCVPVTATAASRHHDSAQGRSFCGEAKAVAKYLSTTLKLSASGAFTATPANLKLAYTTVVNAEGALTATAPATLKPSLAAAFSWVNLVKADFEKAGWRVANMTPYFPALAAKSKADAKQLAAVKTYLRGTCHVPI